MRYREGGQRAVLSGLKQECEVLATLLPFGEQKRKNVNVMTEKRETLYAPHRNSLCFIMACLVFSGVTVFNRQSLIYQYFNMAPRLSGKISGHFSIVSQFPKDT